VRLLTLIGLLPLLAHGLALAAAAPASPAAAGVSPAERRVREIVRLIDSGDRKAAEAYVRANYAPQLLDNSPAEHVNFLTETRERTGGLELASVAAEGGKSGAAGGEATAQLRAVLTEEWVALRVRVEAEPLHRVTFVGRVRPTPPADDRPAVRMSDAAIAGAVGAYAEKLARADAFSGVVLLARGGEPFFLIVYGQANKDFRVPVRPDTRFSLGSVTKMFTAVAVLQLAEQGKLSLDDPLSKFCPDLPDAESARRITIRHLLTHTSGLGDHVSAMYRDPNRTRFRTVDRMLEFVRGVPPTFEPGSRWAYSNSGFLVLGKVIERASGGEDYYDYVRRHVFQAAGMADTDFPDVDRVNADLAVGYERVYARGTSYWRTNHFDQFARGGPEGGACSTARDLLRFDRALRSHRLLSPESTRQAMTSKPELKSPGYGYGFEVEADGRIVGHGGGFVGVQTKLDMYPDGDYTAIVLSNYSGGARPVVYRIRELLLAPTTTP
jgi:CubicO group peptidase (beta-lactamase class C family)